MTKQQITRRQKNISRLLREKKQAYRDKLKTRRHKSVKRRISGNI